jgi:hypothetical protein
MQLFQIFLIHSLLVELADAEPKVRVEGLPVFDPKSQISQNHHNSQRQTGSKPRASHSPSRSDRLSWV